MWISKQNSQTRPEETTADSGVVTLSGTSLAAYSGGEWRELSLFSPGGVKWKPEVGQQVLLLRLGSEGTPCVAGALCADTGDLAPGEVRLSSKGASLTLRNDGTIELCGQLVTKEGDE
jgi:hypothetical protein